MSIVLEIKPAKIKTWPSQAISKVTCKDALTSTWQILDILECEVGYYNENCSLRCPNGTYGKDCQKKCSCSEDECHFERGCSNEKQGNYNLWRKTEQNTSHISGLFYLSM